MKKVTKRLTALLLALVMSLTLLPTQVLAAESGTVGYVESTLRVDPVYSSILKVRIPDISSRQKPTAMPAESVTYLSEMAAVEEVRRQMLTRAETIPLSLKLPSGSDIQGTLARIWDSALEHTRSNGTGGDYLRWQGGKYFYYPGFSYRDNGSYITFTMYFQTNWFTTAQQEATLSSYIKGTLLPQLALDGKSTYQKVQAIYDWITRNVRYDYANLGNDSYLLQYTAYAAVINRTAVCNGYASLFYRLANDAGIDCRFITGTAGGYHAWNIVRMDNGKYYCLDATWDEGQTNYRYFLKGTTEFGQDHTVITDENNTYFWNQYPVSATDFDPNAPLPPAAPTVTMTYSDSGKPKLTWNAVSGATSYRVFRSESRGTGYSLLGTTTATSYTNTGAAVGKTYYYRVKAVNNVGTSGYSNIVSGKAKTAAPAAPSVTIGNSSTGKPQLTWKAVSGAVKYEVYRSTRQNSGYSLLGTTTSTSYVNTGASTGTTYYYRVKAVNRNGMASGYSNIVSGKAKAAAPAAPSVTIGNSSTGKPRLTWKAVSGAVSYRIYRSESRGTGYSLLGTTSSTSYVNTGAAVGKTYYYRVKAVNRDGMASGYSNIVSGKATLPAPVLNIGLSVSSGKPKLTWNAVSGATSYRVFRSESRGSGYSLLGTTTSTSYTNTGAAAGKTYYYRVKAVNSVGTSGYSNIVSGKAKAAAPAAPTVTMTYAASGKPKLTWNAVSGAVSYRIYRSESRGTGYSLLGTTSSTSYVNTGAAVGKTYYYRVKAVNRDGMASGYSNIVSGKATLPAPVLNIGLSVSSGKPMLAWDAVPGATSYRIYRSTSRGSGYSLLATTTSTSHVNTSAAKGTTYYYRVKACSAAGLSPYSNIVSARPGK